MKKLYTLIMAVITAGSLNAQTVIYDNGPLVNGPGQGFGGADNSHTHDGLVNYGFNQNFGLTYSMADDFIVPQGEIWNIDSVVLFGYQTNSTTTSTFTEMYFQIWDGDPTSGTANIVYGDLISNVISISDFSGIYRTTETDLLGVARPIMRNTATPSSAVSLIPGTYWIEWSQAGTLASGPWCPPITNANTVTGNAYQNVAGTYQPVKDSSAAQVAEQGMPFLLVGSVVTGIHDLNAENNINVFPNPFAESTKIKLNLKDADFKNGDVRIEVYSQTGAIVRLISDVRTNTVIVKRDDLKDGAYFFKVFKGNKTVGNGKLMVR